MKWNAALVLRFSFSGSSSKHTRCDMNSNGGQQQHQLKQKKAKIPYIRRPTTATTLWYVLHILCIWTWKCERIYKFKVESLLFFQFLLLLFSFFKFSFRCFSRLLMYNAHRHILWIDAESHLMMTLRIPEYYRMNEFYYFWWLCCCRFFWFGLVPSTLSMLMFYTHNVLFSLFPYIIFLYMCTMYGYLWGFFYLYLYGYTCLCVHAFDSWWICAFDTHFYSFHSERESELANEFIVYFHFFCLHAAFNYIQLLLLLYIHSSILSAAAAAAASLALTLCVERSVSSLSFYNLSTQSRFTWLVVYMNYMYTLYIVSLSHMYVIENVNVCRCRLISVFYLYKHTIYSFLSRYLFLWERDRSLRCVHVCIYVSCMCRAVSSCCSFFTFCLSLSLFLPLCLSKPFNVL